MSDVYLLHNSSKFWICHDVSFRIKRTFQFSFTSLWTLKSRLWNQQDIWTTMFHVSGKRTWNQFFIKWHSWFKLIRWWVMSIAYTIAVIFESVITCHLGWKNISIFLYITVNVKVSPLKPTRYMNNNVLWFWKTYFKSKFY